MQESVGKRMKNKLLVIFNSYGIMNQINKLHEETQELLDAINEYELYYFNGNEQIEKYLRYHIEDEIADVLVVLQQFYVKYKLDININDKQTKPNLKRLPLIVSLFCEYVPAHIYCLRYYRQLMEQLNNIIWFYELDKKLIIEFMKYKINRQVHKLKEY